MKFYRGAANAARSYVERDRSRADDHYLSEGTGVAVRLAATSDGVEQVGNLTADSYEQWVAGIDIESGKPKGRLRKDPNALRFVAVTVNGPKTWSLAAALHPEISASLDAAQDRAAGEIVSWVGQHATTLVGPRGRQVQVPVERIEAVVIRHYTSRAGDPHRHLHLQINARVWAAGAWRGIHSVGIRDSIEAINGIGHAAVMTDPEFRSVLAGQRLHGAGPVAPGERSAWNAADIRGHVEVLLTQANLVAPAAARTEPAEDITARAIERCAPLLLRSDVPEHVRAYSSPPVLEVEAEAEIIQRMAARAVRPARCVRLGGRGFQQVDPTQAAVVGALTGDGQLLVVEGAAGAGKTTALRSAQTLLSRRGHRLVVVTPTLKAAEVAAAETGAEGHSAAWLIHQHGWRWDNEGHWIRRPEPTPAPGARIQPGDLLLVDVAGTLDQDTARALFTRLERHAHLPGEAGPSCLPTHGRDHPGVIP